MSNSPSSYSSRRRGCLALPDGLPCIKVRALFIFSFPFLFGFLSPLIDVEVNAPPNTTVKITLHIRGRSEAACLPLVSVLRIASLSSPSLSPLPHNWDIRSGDAVGRQLVGTR